VCSLIVTWLLRGPLFRLGASYTLHLSVCLSVYFVQHGTDSDLLRLDLFLSNRPLKLPNSLLARAVVVVVVSRVRRGVVQLSPYDI
jgi:hypothetical protein